jgi:hypothetical protein
LRQRVERKDFIVEQQRDELEFATQSSPITGLKKLRAYGAPVTTTKKRYPEQKLNGFRMGFLSNFPNCSLPRGEF